MKFDFESLNEDMRYRLMLATVLPRPIAWVTSQDRNGLVNAAPFSFFNVFGTEPATVGIGVGRNSPTQPKDTCLNIRATGGVRRQFGSVLCSGKDASEFYAISVACQRSLGRRPSDIAE